MSTESSLILALRAIFFLCRNGRADRLRLFSLDCPSALVYYIQAVERLTSMLAYGARRTAEGACVLLLLLLFFPVSRTASITLSPVRIVRVDDLGVEVEVDAGRDVQIESAEDSLTSLIVTVPGFDRDCVPGGPCLPVKSFALAVPAEGDPAVTIMEKSSRELPGTGLKGETPPENLPLQPVRVVLTGFVRDTRVAQILVEPVVYLPGSGLLVFYEKMRFRVDWGAAPSISEEEVFGADPLGSLVSSLVVNPEHVSRFKVRRERTRIEPNLLQTTTERYKIAVEDEGIYRLTGSEMEAGGMDIAGVDPRMLHLENMGKKIPIYVKGGEDGKLDPDDYVEFYGESPKGDYTYMSLYATENVYWLYEGDSLGIPIIEEDGGLSKTDPALLETPISYEFTVHSEVDNWFERLPDDTAREQDVWFWDMVSASEQGIKDFALNLPGPDPASDDTVGLEVGLQGLSHESSVSPDHHCLVYLNGILAGGTYWDGQHSHEFISEKEGSPVENHVLLESANKLSIVMPGDTPAGSDDRILLNWIRLTYTRLYRASGDYIRFSRPRRGKNGLYQFTVEGFTSPEVSVYKLGKSKLVNLAVKPVIAFGETLYDAVFQTDIVSDGVEFVALTEGKRKKVLSFEKDEPSELRSPLNSADLIVIVHDSLAAAAEEYVAFRESQGLRVVLARTSDIYDEFNYGVRDAKAIKQFLEFAYEHWTAPSFSACVLLGDGNSDDRDLGRRGGNLIPIHVERSIYSGLVASENWYACVSGEDFLPDVAISRIPANTAGELSLVIEKLRASADLGPWRRSVLHVAGSGGSFGLEFRTLMEDSIREVQTPFWVEPLRVYAEKLPGVDPDPYYGGRTELLNYMNGGASVVQYLGHGSGGTWSSPYLLTPEDVPNLQNGGRLPLVASFTCFTSVFDQPTRHSLGEALVLEPGRGASGVIGTTALGYFWEDLDMARSFNETIYRNSEPRTLGEVFLEMKLKYAFENYGGYATTMIKCQTLLGDPASAFLLPPPSVEMSADPRSVEPGDSLTVLIATQGGVGDSVFITLSDSSSDFASFSAPLDQGKASFTTEVPQGVNPGFALARAYAWEAVSSTDMAGSAEFAISRPALFMIRTLPDSPDPWDSVHVEAGVFYEPGIDSVFCMWARSRNPSSWNRIPMAAVAQDTFRTASPIAPQTPGRPVCYRVGAYGSDGTLLESRIGSYPALEKPNLILLREEDVFLGGTRSVELSAKIFNSGDVNVDSCPVLFRSYPDSAVIGEGWASVGPLAYGEASVRWIPGGPRSRVYVDIDPANLIDESVETDNSSIGFPTTILANRFNVTRETGTGGWVASIDSNVACSIPPDAVADSSVLVIEALAPHSICQPGVRFASLKGSRTGSAYALSFADTLSLLQAGGMVDLQMRFDGSDSLNGAELDLLSIYRYVDNPSKWKRWGGTVDSSLVTGQTDRLGQFAVMASRDTEPPKIKVSVKDQAFADGDFVPANPEISFLLVDENGIDTERGLVISLDGRQATAGEFVYPEKPSDGNEVQSAFYPELADGTHTISVECWDCVGNYASEELSVTVQTEFRVEYLANYPNPARSNETVFTFVLTGAAEEADLRIYSPSGRVVRTFTRGRWWDLSDIGYHEVPWDLRDEEGIPVANGVYFYVLSAKKEGKAVKEKRKLAVLR
jgi:hypothetical protein